MFKSKPIPTEIRDKQVEIATEATLDSIIKNSSTLIEQRLKQIKPGILEFTPCSKNKLKQITTKPLHFDIRNSIEEIILYQYIGYGPSNLKLDILIEDGVYFLNLIHKDSQKILKSVKTEKVSTYKYIKSAVKDFSEKVLHFSH